MAMAKSFRSFAAVVGALSVAKSSRRYCAHSRCESAAMVSSHGGFSLARFRAAEEKQLGALPFKMKQTAGSKCIPREVAASLSPEKSLRELPSTISEYDLERRIGEGGCGEVFRARHVASGARFAAKRGLRSHPDIAHIFESEVKALAKVDHPNVVRFIEGFSDAKYVYIIEELCSGPTLMQLLEQSPAELDEIPYLPEKQAAGVIRQCLEALSACHSQGLAHRDVKLENFVLSDGGTVKLFDFGSAGTMESDRKDDDEIMTTLEYMAPEMLRDSQTIAVDIWSLGVVFFGLLTGEQLLNCCSDRAVCSCLRDAHYVKRRLAESRAVRQLGISEAALDLLQQMLERDPAKRITAAAALGHPCLHAAALSE